MTRNLVERDHVQMMSIQVRVMQYIAIHSKVLVLYSVEEVKDELFVPSGVKVNIKIHDIAVLQLLLLQEVLMHPSQSVEEKVVNEGSTKRQLHRDCLIDGRRFWNVWISW